MEAQHKATQDKKIKQELELKVCKFKQIEASQAIMSLMYARQKFFDYRDKPNKQLARLLAQAQSNSVTPEAMFTAEGQEVRNLPDKLKIFTEYYKKLYETTNPTESDIDLFLII